MSETLADTPRIIAETPFPSAEATKCPYPFYQALRDIGPVYRLPTGEYVISRHADIAHVARNPDIFSSRHCMFEDGWMRAATLADLEDDKRPWGIVTSDAPVHTAKRMMALEIFKPARLNERAPMIARYVDELLDTFVDRGECEFVSEFARLLPARVILTMLGLPLQDVDRALEWAHYEGFGMRFASPESQAAARESVLDMSRYLHEHILKKVENPGDDDLSRHIQAHMAQDGKLDMPNLIAEGMNLFNGGIITTSHLLANMMMLFIQNPEEQAKARASQANLKNAIEESLRIDAPVQLSLRLVRQDTEVGGVKIKAGEMVIVVWGSGNRDGGVFDHADSFDVERPNARSHLAFGGGAHLCIGAPLGRMEVLTAYERIFARMKNLRFVPGKNDFENLPAVIFRGPQHLYIEFDRA